MGIYQRALREILDKLSSGEYTFLNDPRDLNNVLNKYEYGIFIDNQTYTEYPIPWNKYRTLSVEEFQTHRVGCCWDFVMYESYWFNYKKIPHKLYYIEGGNKETHTFLVYKNNDKFYLFESSWQLKKGIYGFETEKELLDYYSKEFLKHLESENKNSYVLYEYKQPIQSGLTSVEFMKYIYLSGKMLRNINKYYENEIKPWMETGFVNSNDIDNSLEKFNRVRDIVKQFSEEEQMYFNLSQKPGNLVSCYVHKDEDGNEVGFMNLLHLKTTKGYSYDIAYVEFGILPEYRHKGYTKLLLNVAIIAAMDNGFKELQVRVNKSNIAAVRVTEQSKLFNLKKDFLTEKVYSKTF